MDNLWEVHLGDDFQAVVCASHAAKLIGEIDSEADRTIDYINDQTGIWVVEDVFGQIETDECYDCEYEARNNG